MLPLRTPQVPVVTPAQPPVAEVEVILFIEDVIDVYKSRVEGYNGHTLPKSSWHSHLQRAKAASLAPGPPSATSDASSQENDRKIWRTRPLSVHVLPTVTGSALKELLAVEHGFPLDRMILFYRSDAELRDSDLITKYGPSSAHILFSFAPSVVDDVAQTAAGPVSQGSRVSRPGHRRHSVRILSAIA